MNILAVSLKQIPGLTKDLINTYPIRTLINNALISNQMGSGSLVIQIEILKKRFKEFESSLNGYKFTIPAQLSSTSGIRLKFLQVHGYNPAISHAWL